ncbi:hypothetical protein TNCV_385341 [Trichonephila clavipes]|nr:hypothetical protein TNCV_385341 [Trichonephila clavipes]
MLISKATQIAVWINCEEEFCHFCSKMILDSSMSLSVDALHARCGTQNNSQWHTLQLSHKSPCFSILRLSTEWRRRQSGFHRFQCILYPFWHSRRAVRPRQKPGQASGGILSKSHDRWLDESRQQPWLSPGASGLTSQWPEFPMTFQGS